MYLKCQGAIDFKKNFWRRVFYIYIYVYFFLFTRRYSRRITTAWYFLRSTIADRAFASDNVWLRLGKNWDYHGDDCKIFQRSFDGSAIFYKHYWTRIGDEVSSADTLDHRSSDFVFCVSLVLGVSYVNRVVVLSSAMLSHTHCKTQRGNHVCFESDL